MFLSRLFHRRETAEYRVLVQAKTVRQPSPLPALGPVLYRGKPHDGFAGLETLLLEAEDAVVDGLKRMHIEGSKPLNTFSYNINQVLQIPAIYNLIAVMRSRGMESQLTACHLMATALQACCWRGKSEFAPSLPKFLMPMLLGIYARYFGIQYLKREELDILNQKRKFDMSSEKERELRDEHFARYRTAVENLAQVSSNRFDQAMGKSKKKGHEEYRQIVQDIILYSSRLMGRTAVELQGQTERGIHQSAAYIGVLHSLMAAQEATRKRLCLLMAEEYGRNRVHRKHQGLEQSARYNLFALADIMRASRCHVLEFFQGKDETV
ncbi:MAG: hypothetical protein ACYTGH_04395, partial [Planctomycetota bacterium]